MGVGEAATFEETTVAGAGGAGMGAVICWVAATVAPELTGMRAGGGGGAGGMRGGGVTELEGRWEFVIHYFSARAF